MMDVKVSHLTLGPLCLTVRSLRLQRAVSVHHLAITMETEGLQAVPHNHRVSERRRGRHRWENGQRWNTAGCAHGQRRLSQGN